MKIKFKGHRSAFTLIEMTIVLFIISLLILIVIPNLTNQRNNAKTIHGTAMESVIQTQIDSYLNENTDDNNVTYGLLVNKGYLSEKQARQAQKNGIRIVNNNAEK
ncbi:prepilin-type N-terminal cleavage/methylation domain-containing protein [Lactobacillus sp. Sy-1]|uniref:prepilin-type N-terminal cleavage/methylation domain-containing protein n=1 Tax=Lactobacillus sp. Sy-1 TaxID=2109645 RepID=UPI001C57EB4A|nr:prepilin-type N-terminal cleavage/methylation domain-containing protein [Lactobacillus sp. Sy-1]MBW1605766.1 prepilin-type N-terminal cleavage/methylation domain-containing protein [Lactobacillus sp. Sy-1]